MTEDDKNPLLEPENYYDGYQESIDKNKSNPDFVDLEKLCHLVFHSPDGKQLLEEIDKRFLIPSLASPMAANYKTMVIYVEGYKEAFRFLKQCVLSHDQRIKAEMNKK